MEEHVVAIDVDVLIIHFHKLFTCNSAFLMTNSAKYFEFYHFLEKAHFSASL